MPFDGQHFALKEIAGVKALRGDSPVVAGMAYDTDKNGIIDYVAYALRKAEATNNVLVAEKLRDMMSKKSYKVNSPKLIYEAMGIAQSLNLHMDAHMISAKYQAGAYLAVKAVMDRKDKMAEKRGKLPREFGDLYYEGQGVSGKTLVYNPLHLINDIQKGVVSLSDIYSSYTQGAKKALRVIFASNDATNLFRVNHIPYVAPVVLQETTAIIGDDERLGIKSRIFHNGGWKDAGLAYRNWLAEFDAEHAIKLKKTCQDLKTYLMDKENGFPLLFALMGYVRDYSESGLDLPAFIAKKFEVNSPELIGRYAGYMAEAIELGYKMPNKDVQVCFEIVRIWKQNVINRAVQRTREYVIRSTGNGNDTFTGYKANEHILYYKLLMDLPKKFRPGNTKDALLEVMHKRDALQYPYIEFDKKRWNVIRVDLDKTWDNRTAFEADMMKYLGPDLLPNMVVMTANPLDMSGKIHHPHIYFMLNTPAVAHEGKNGGPRSEYTRKMLWRFADNVNRLYHILAPMGADPGGKSNKFHGKNPFCPSNTTYIYAEESYNMADIYHKLSHLGELELKLTKGTTLKKKSSNHLYNTCSAWLRIYARTYIRSGGTRDAMIDALVNHCHQTESDIRFSVQQIRKMAEYTGKFWWRFSNRDGVDRGALNRNGITHGADKRERQSLGCKYSSVSRSVKTAMKYCAWIREARDEGVPLRTSPLAAFGKRMGYQICGRTLDRCKNVYYPRLDYTVDQWKDYYMEKFLGCKPSTPAWEVNRKKTVRIKKDFLNKFHENVEAVYANAVADVADQTITLNIENDNSKMTAYTTPESEKLSRFFKYNLNSINAFECSTNSGSAKNFAKNKTHHKHHNITFNPLQTSSDMVCDWEIRNKNHLPSPKHYLPGLETTKKMSLKDEAQVEVMLENCRYGKKYVIKRKAKTVVRAAHVDMTDLIRFTDQSVNKQVNRNFKRYKYLLGKVKHQERFGYNDILLKKLKKLPLIVQQYLMGVPKSVRHQNLDMTKYLIPETAFWVMHKMVGLEFTPGMGWFIKTSLYKNKSVMNGIFIPV